jgi:hypothetical protein
MIHGQKNIKKYTKLFDVTADGNAYSYSEVLNS